MDFLIDGSLGAGVLAIGLLFALGFEFVTGFHDTANAVATVIYTHTLTPSQAVVWSGLWNFIGVLTSSGAVALGAHRARLHAARLGAVRRQPVRDPAPVRLSRLHRWESALPAHGPLNLP